MSPISSAASFILAKKHLERVQTSWDPPEWLDLAAYGLYAIEAAVVAAALRMNLPVQGSHWSKVEAAQQLSKLHGLPDVAKLMRELNDLRKSEAYGDMTVPRNIHPQVVAKNIESFVDAVGMLLDGHEDE